MFMAGPRISFGGNVFGLLYGMVEGVIEIGAALGAWSAGFVLFSPPHSGERIGFTTYLTH
jgi:hypothetical protein